MSVQSWALPAPEPTAGWPRPLMADEFRGWPRGTLRNPTEAGQILGRAVGYWDAAFSADSQTVPNLGTGGSALDATLGSSGSADSNDPKWLPYHGTPYVYLPGASGNYLSVAAAAATNLTGDVAAVVDVAADDYTPASDPMRLVGTRGSSAAGFEFMLRGSGNLEFQWRDSGTGSWRSGAVAGGGLTDGARFQLAACLDADNGAGGCTVYFWKSQDGGATWTSVSSVTPSGGVAAIVSPGNDVEVGTRNTNNDALAGRVYGAKIHNGIDGSGKPGGSVVLNVDCSVLTSGSSTSFTATTGQTVTINRATSGRKTVCVTQPCWLFGTDDYLEVAHSPLLDFLATDSFTIGTWVRMWATPTNNGSLASKRDSSGAGWKIRSNGTGYGPAGVASDGTNTALPTGPASSAGVLAVLSMVVDRATQTSVAYTGASAGTAASLSAVASLASPGVQFRVGRDGGSGTNYQDFELTRAAIWREALTARDIATLAA